MSTTRLMCVRGRNRSAKETFIRRRQGWTSPTTTMPGEHQTSIEMERGEPAWLGLKTITLRGGGRGVNIFAVVRTRGALKGRNREKVRSLWCG